MLRYLDRRSLKGGEGLRRGVGQQKQLLKHFAHLVNPTNSLVLLVKSFTKYMLLYNRIYHISTNPVNAANDMPALRLTLIHVVEFILSRGLF